MRKIIAEGNVLGITRFMSASDIRVTVLVTEYGDDNVRCELEDGILYVYNNGELVACSNRFTLEYKDKTK